MKADGCVEHSVGPGPDRGRGRAGKMWRYPTFINLDVLTHISLSITIKPANKTH